MRWWLAALLGLLACGLPASEDLDQRIPAAPGGVLEVDLDLGEGLRPDPGRLEVRSHDAEVVRIRAAARGWGAWGAGFRVDREGDAVRLVGRVEGPVTWLFGGPRSEVQIWVPREYAVDLHCRGGAIRVGEVGGRVRARSEGAGIEVAGAEGPVRLRSDGGDIRVSEVVGPVDARTTSGSIEVSWVTGDVEVRSGGGAIAIERVEGSLDAKTERGNIDLVDVSGPAVARTERGRVFASFVGDPAGLLETRRGPVEVSLPERAGAELEAQTRRGSVEVARELAFEPAGAPAPDHASGRLNRGGAPLRLYTTYGGVRVRAR